MRARLAPRARRTAISLRRPAARASIILPTLAHAISMTRPAITVKNDVKNGRSCLRSGSSFPPSTSSTRRPFWELAASPFSCSICCVVASSSASTRAMGTPGRSRPTIRYGATTPTHRKRHPKVGPKERRRRAEELFRTHAHHGGGLRIDAQRFADCGWVGGQLLLPKPVTDHHGDDGSRRSEEHSSELQSLRHLV